MDNKEWMDDNTNCSGCISLIWNAWTFQLKSVPAFHFFGLWNICICTMRYLEHWPLVKYTKFIYFGYTLYIENKDKSGVFIMPVFWLQPVAWVQGWNFPFIVTWLCTQFLGSGIVCVLVGFVVNLTQIRIIWIREKFNQEAASIRLTCRQVCVGLCLD